MTVMLTVLSLLNLATTPKDSGHSLKVKELIIVVLGPFSIMVVLTAITTPNVIY